MLRNSVAAAFKAARAGNRTLATSAGQRRVAFVDGVRTPFLMSGTSFNDYIAQDLGREAVKGVLTRTAVDPGALDKVIMGTVIQEVRTSNIAREAALAAGVPETVPAHTVTMACISSNAAIADCSALMQSGHADLTLAGGAETMSDVPIRYPRRMRKLLLQLNKAKTMSQRLSLAAKIRLGHFAPEAPAIAEFSTGEVMGHSSDRLAARFGVTREEQDAYALDSHKKAAAATQAGTLRHEIVPVDGILEDNGIKGDTSMEKLQSLKPSFVKPHGTHTAANSSFLTDGAAACLLCAEDKLAEHGLEAKSFIRDWVFVSQDPKDELLLGPAYAISRILHHHGLTPNDIDVFELHEAFAGQVLANLAALKDKRFCVDQAGVPDAVGEIDRSKLNAWGGALAIGHPFGATGTRLVTTASNRLQQEKGKLALVAACAAGGQGVAMLLEHP